MKKLILLTLSLILITPLAYAEKPHGPKATEVNISVGTEDGQIKFTPESLTFERGTYYKLVITNPSRRITISPRMHLRRIYLLARLK